MDVVFQSGAYFTVNADEFSFHIEEGASGVSSDDLAIRLQHAVLDGHDTPQTDDRATGGIITAGVSQGKDPFADDRWSRRDGNSRA